MPISDYCEEKACPECGGVVYQDFSGIHINCFQSYVDIHTTGKPVELTSPRKRDEFHNAHGVTLDNNRYGKRQKSQSAVDSVDTGQILHDLKTGNFPRAKDQSLAPVDVGPLQTHNI